MSHRENKENTMEIPGNIYPELIDKLRAPVPDELLSWRIQRSGERNGQPWALLAPYIDSRILMARLDLIFGSDGWQSRSVIGGYGAEVMAKSRRDGSEYEMLVQHGAVAVEIGIWNGEEWIWKGDGASGAQASPILGERGQQLAGMVAAGVVGLVALSFVEVVERNRVLVRLERLPPVVVHMASLSPYGTERVSGT